MPRKVGTVTVGHPVDKEKCIIDHHIDYRGNDIGPKSSQTDFKECLVHCRREGAKYFTFLGNNDCWCKTSDVGAGSVPDAVSGPATCYSSHGFEDPGTEFSYTQLRLYGHLI